MVLKNGTKLLRVFARYLYVIYVVKLYNNKVFNGAYFCFYICFILYVFLVVIL